MIDLITGNKKTKLSSLIDMSEIKFKEIDEMVEILQSWHSRVEFKMEQHRDQRLRYHFGKRYDYRANMIDWDYNMGVKSVVPVCHWFHYRDWRKGGVAFETRFATYIESNRTMGSYLPGKKKLTRESCLVRGYWGDIIVSPYIAMGVETDYEPEKTKLFKVANMQ
jgi:dynein assembly factor 3